MSPPMERPGVSSASSPVEEVNEGPCGELSKILGSVSMWLFHLHSAVKIQPFSPVFPLAGTADKAFVGYPFGTLKRNVSTIFYDTAKSFSPMPLHERRLCHGM